MAGDQGTTATVRAVLRHPDARSAPTRTGNESTAAQAGHRRADRLHPDPAAAAEDVAVAERRAHVTMTHDLHAHRRPTARRRARADDAGGGAAPAPRRSRPVGRSPAPAEPVGTRGRPSPGSVVRDLGLGRLFFVAFLLVLSPIQQSRAQSVLYTQFRSELDAATAPFGVDPIPPGDPVALIEVPAVGHPAGRRRGHRRSRDLRNGPGHLRVTPLPGQLGTSVIFGRSTTYGGPFQRPDVPAAAATRSR